MKQRKIPQRKCIACQKMLGKREMVRIVRTPEGRIEVDLTGKKNGRGAYLCGKLEGLNKAKKTKALDRALKANIPPEIYADLEEEFEHFNDKYVHVKCELNVNANDGSGDPT